MSSIGHVMDMLRRDKENREWRKQNAENRKDRLSKITMQQKIDYNQITPQDVEDVFKKTEEKKANDEAIMAKTMAVILTVGIIMGATGLFVLRKMGIL